MICIKTWLETRRWFTASERPLVHVTRIVTTLPMKNRAMRRYQNGSRNEKTLSRLCASVNRLTSWRKIRIWTMILSYKIKSASLPTRYLQIRVTWSSARIALAGSTRRLLRGTLRSVHRFRIDPSRHRPRSSWKRREILERGSMDRLIARITIEINSCVIPLFMRPWHRPVRAGIHQITMVN